MKHPTTRSLIFIFQAAAVTGLLFILGIATELSSSSMATTQSNSAALPEFAWSEDWLNNPLSPYVEFLKAKDQYEKAGKSRDYAAKFADTMTVYGDVQAVMQYRTQMEFPPIDLGAPILESRLSGYQRLDAIPFILKEADEHNVIMCGEEHMDPQTRSILLPLLRGLRAKGFEYFAAETFQHDLNETKTRGYTVLHTGYYTKDPIYAEAVNEAIRLGFKLIPYEVENEPEKIRRGDPSDRNNFREESQAKNLKKEIFDKDPKAKVLVWAGRGHVYTDMSRTKIIDKDGKLSDKAVVWTPMAYIFEKLTGIHPANFILCQQNEFSSREQETHEYKLAADNDLLPVPTVFIDAKGKGYGERGCLDVFFPRQSFRHGRADWMIREISRVEVAIPSKCIAQNGLQIAQVFPVGKVENAIPVDQILIKTDEVPPFLMVPRGGKFLVRVRDVTGKIVGEDFVSTAPL